MLEFLAGAEQCVFQFCVTSLKVWRNGYCRILDISKSVVDDS